MRFFLKNIYLLIFVIFSIVSFMLETVYATEPGAEDPYSSLPPFNEEAVNFILDTLIPKITQIPSVPEPENIEASVQSIHQVINFLFSLTLAKTDDLFLNSLNQLYYSEVHENWSNNNSIFQIKNNLSVNYFYIDSLNVNPSKSLLINNFNLTKDNINNFLYFFNDLNSLILAYKENLRSESLYKLILVNSFLENTTYINIFSQDLLNVLLSQLMKSKNIRGEKGKLNSFILIEETFLMMKTYSPRSDLISYTMLLFILKVSADRVNPNFNSLLLFLNQFSDTKRSEILESSKIGVLLESYFKEFGNLDFNNDNELENIVSLLSLLRDHWASYTNLHIFLKQNLLDIVIPQLKNMNSKRVRSSGTLPSLILSLVSITPELHREYSFLFEYLFIEHRKSYSDSQISQIKFSLYYLRDVQKASLDFEKYKYFFDLENKMNLSSTPSVFDDIITSFLLYHDFSRDDFEFEASFEKLQRAVDLYFDKEYLAIELNGGGHYDSEGNLQLQDIRASEILESGESPIKTKRIITTSLSPKKPTEALYVLRELGDSYNARRSELGLSVLNFDYEGFMESQGFFDTNIGQCHSVIGEM